MDILPQFLLLLALAVGAILLARKIHVPSTIAYLAVGVMLGPFTVGPILDRNGIAAVAEYGIVFLLFTIGLSFSLPELKALGRKLPVLGAAQVGITTILVMAGAWALGVPLVAAFVVGAVFAQSSSTIISKQLAEQGEEASSSGRMGLAMSIFQDVTAVPFVVVIPVLAVAVSPELIAGELGLALVKALLAIAAVLIIGRWVLRPLIHLVARARSAELFTLTVLLVVLAAAWTSEWLGLSLAFGAFLAGMSLGETEFRHQVESTIRPFRDVLLGLFFIAIGMLFDPLLLPEIWPWVLVGTLGLMIAKAIPVAILTRVTGFDLHSAIRTGLLLSVGGEFGFALIAIALTSGALDEDVGQVALTSVLTSMVVGTFAIRFNAGIASAVATLGRASRRGSLPHHGDDEPLVDALEGHVVLCGYGRIGQSVAHFLDSEDIPYLAFDLDAERVKAARETSMPVFFGDSAEPAILKSMGVARARLVVIAHNDHSAAMKTLQYLDRNHPEVPVLVRTRDDSHVSELKAAGALDVVPETLEAGLSIASQVLVSLGVGETRIAELIREQRSGRYRLIQEYFPSGDAGTAISVDRNVRPISVETASDAVGQSVGEVVGDALALAAVLRDHVRVPDVRDDFILQAGDVVVVYGDRATIDALERRLGVGSRGLPGRRGGTTRP